MESVVETSLDKGDSDRLRGKPSIEPLFRDFLTPEPYLHVLTEYFPIFWLVFGEKVLPVSMISM